jgi:hypothetical protein
MKKKSKETELQAKITSFIIVVKQNLFGNIGLGPNLA